VVRAVPSGRSVQRPAARRVYIIWGKVKSRKERRLKVSIV